MTKRTVRELRLFLECFKGDEWVYIHEDAINVIGFMAYNHGTFAENPENDSVSKMTREYMEYYMIKPLTRMNVVPKVD